MRRSLWITCSNTLFPTKQSPSYRPLYLAHVATKALFFCFFKHVLPWCLLLVGCLATTVSPKKKLPPNAPCWWLSKCMDERYGSCILPKQKIHLKNYTSKYNEFGRKAPQILQGFQPSRGFQHLRCGYFDVAPNRSLWNLDLCFRCLLKWSFHVEYPHGRKYLKKTLYKHNQDYEGKSSWWLNQPTWNI